jgi:LysM repeat protein
MHSCVPRPAFPVSATCSRRSPLGRRGTNSARIRIPNRLPKAAGPTLLGVAAAVALSAQVTASPALASTTAHHAAHQQGVSNALLLSAIHPVAADKPTVGHPTRYTVQAGDSLSTIAQHFYRNSGAWPVLYWANRGNVHWANDINAGQVLKIPAKPARIPAAPTQFGPAAAPAAPSEQASTEQAAPAEDAAPAQAASTYTGSGSFQQCVIASESGGSSQVMNSSGHYGLYQFSASTWASYGGNPADFGNASTGEQNQVFDNAIAAGGQSNWSAYDGC